MNSIKNMSYRERLLELGIPSLQYRRVRADMIEVYKIINGFDKYALGSQTELPYSRTESQISLSRYFSISGSLEHFALSEWIFFR